MGQIFNRIKNISSSYFNEDNFIESDIFIDEDEELKKIIDNLDSGDFKSAKNDKENHSSKQFYSKPNQNYYSILGVNSNATKEEISIAYRNMIKKYHPDKVANLGQEFQELAILKTKEINFAYQKIKEERKW